MFYKKVNKLNKNDKEKYLQFGKFTRDCPQWILDKVATIDNSNIDEEYVKKVLSAIIDEFDSSKHEITSTNDIWPYRTWI